MTSPRRSAGSRERRLALYLAATGLHSASPVVASAQRAPRLQVPRPLRRAGRERPDR